MKRKLDLRSQPIRYRGQGTDAGLAAFGRIADPNEAHRPYRRDIPSRLAVRRPEEGQGEAGRSHLTLPLSLLGRPRSLRRETSHPVGGVPSNLAFSNRGWQWQGAPRRPSRLQSIVKVTENNGREPDALPTPCPLFP